MKLACLVSSLLVARRVVESWTPSSSLPVRTPSLGHSSCSSPTTKSTTTTGSFLPEAAANPFGSTAAGNNGMVTSWSRRGQLLSATPSTVYAVIGEESSISLGSRSTSASSSSRSNSHSSGLLSRTQEVELTFCIRRFRAVVRMRDQLSQQRSSNDMLPPTEAEWANACGMSVMELRKVMQQGQEAREILVAANVGLVTSIAKRHYQALKQAAQHNRPVLPSTLQDLIQEGNVGILAAAERFEPEKGFRFSTYATWWIRQRILRSISDSGRIIRLPAHVHSTLQRIRKVKQQLTMGYGREPTLAELANELNMTVPKLQKYTDSSRHVVSLELPLRAASFKDDRRTIGDVLASDAPSPEEDAQAEYLKRDIQAVMENELAERERHVIEVRFGLQDGKPRTHAETAKLLGISRDRVRLVEARALNKLRSPQRNYRLKEYVVSSSSTSSSSANTHSASDATNAFSTTSSSSSSPSSSSRSRQSTQGSSSPPSRGSTDRIWFF